MDWASNRNARLRRTKGEILEGAILVFFFINVLNDLSYIKCMYTMYTIQEDKYVK